MQITILCSRPSFPQKNVTPYLIRGGNLAGCRSTSGMTAGTSWLCGIIHRSRRGSASSVDNSRRGRPSFQFPLPREQESSVLSVFVLIVRLPVNPWIVVTFAAVCSRTGPSPSSCPAFPRAPRQRPLQSTSPARMSSPKTGRILLRLRSFPEG